MLMLYLSLLTSEDRSFFEKLYLEHRGFLYAYANKILLDEHLAEDAVHNAFMRLINHVNKLSNMDCHKVKPFLIIVVRNASFEIYNKRKTSPVIDVQYDIPDDIRIEDDIHMHFEVEALVAKIEAMPKLYGEVLLLVGTYSL